MSRSVLPDGFMAMLKWLKTRPECVQKLAIEFPFGSIFIHDEKRLYLLGYTENDSLVVSEVDPFDDYDGARESQSYLCADHVRLGVVRKAN